MHIARVLPDVHASGRLLHGIERDVGVAAPYA